MKSKHRVLIAIGAIILVLLLVFWSVIAEAQQVRPVLDGDTPVEDAGNRTVRYSTAGFYPVQGSGRSVMNMDPAWRFARGHHDGAWREDYRGDSAWQTVNVPHGLELLPVEASGGVNYRGEAWYRKYFQTPAGVKGKRLVLWFEGIMGKAKVWVNGRQVAEHFGGFLPVIADIGDAIRPDEGAINVVAVMADNGDDPTYPPGKPQAQLDYCYFGGIYRDVWLVATNKVYITDPNQIDRVAGGGLFFATTRLAENRSEAEVALRLNLANDTRRGASGRVEYTLVGPDGKIAVSKTQSYSVAAGGDRTLDTKMTVRNPALWSPEHPNLYRLNVRVTDRRGVAVDGFMQRVGIRTVAFDPAQGFVLNGKPYPRKLIGGNRHQDYAVVGNALSNNLHWRDAAKLKAAGMEIVRNAHYPQDPAFMDACDELGLLVIVNTPGWQFWNEEPVFGERVYGDVRNMVRRDRNRPSVVMWEPILNETWYPEEFAGKVHDIVKEEYPFPGCYTASDSEAKGHGHFEIQFAHPALGEKESAAAHIDPAKVYFTREWGDNVDDWSSHNSTSRVARDWGEVPQLVQANHYAKNDYSSTSYDALYRAPVYHFGGTLWHPFDHQRGYHPDPFYGGLMDAFRRPKYSYEMFRAQNRRAEPMVFIAHEMTPFSPEDVTVFSNCDTVVLHTFVGPDTVRTYVRGRDCDTTGMPSPAIVFPRAWNFMKDKALSRSGRQGDAYILVEGIRNGQVAASQKKSMSRRPMKLELIVDREGVNAVADGSDLVTVVAQITDGNGMVKRLNNRSVRFTIEGEGRLLVPESQAAGVPLVWGEAPVLVQTTTTPGTVKVRAEIAGVQGDWTPHAAEVEFRTVAPLQDLIYMESEAERMEVPVAAAGNATTVGRRQSEDMLRQVEAQQEAFGEQR